MFYFALVEKTIKAFYDLALSNVLATFPILLNFINLPRMEGFRTIQLLPSEGEGWTHNSDLSEFCNLHNNEISNICTDAKKKWLITSAEGGNIIVLTFLGDYLVVGGYFDKNTMVISIKIFREKQSSQGDGESSSDDTGTNHMFDDVPGGTKNLDGQAKFKSLCTIDDSR